MRRYGFVVRHLRRWLGITGDHDEWKRVSESHASWIERLHVRTTTNARTSKDNSDGIRELRVRIGEGNE